jgi:hypothetical protein
MQRETSLSKKSVAAHYLLHWERFFWAELVLLEPGWVLLAQA